ASPPPYRLVINELALQLPTSSHDVGELCIVNRSQNQDVQTPVVAIEAPAPVPALVPANPAHERRHGNLPETTKSTKKADKSHQVHPSDASKDTVQQVPTRIPEPVVDSSEPLATSADSAADSFVDEVDVCAEKEEATSPPALVDPIEERGDTPDGIDPLNLQFSPRGSPIGTEKALKWADLLVQDEPSDSVAKADDLMPPVPPPVYSEARDNDDPVAILDTQGDSRTNFFPPPTNFNEEAALPTSNQRAIAIVDRDDTPTIPPRGADVGVPEVAPIELILAEVADDVSELAGGSQSEIQTVDASASINVTDASREYIPLGPTLVAPLEEETSVVAVALEEKSAEDKQPSISPDAVHASVPETKSDHQVEKKAEKIEVAAVTEEQMVPQSKADAATVQDPDMSPSPEFREECLAMDSAELRLLEKYIQVVMEIFIDEFEHAERNITSRTGMFSRDQLHKSFLHYGVNHVEFGLNGVFLAIEDDLNTFA
uniref:Uncharacterized protein n=1 Tax=Globisporangium ultimum (strain ATCC 200006 / CBS 805.95 / DAOM BR144) TaxID=431595 RepID=K3XA75_GLOUD